MIKTFHEAPKSIFDQVQKMTDGDYALANLLEDPEYFEMFKSSSREVILDNAVFELGKAFEAGVFAEWVEKLRPTYYIVPDVLEDGEATCASHMDFVCNTGKGLPGKVMGVAQGRNYEEFVKCYKIIEPCCDRIGISFDCSWYIEDPTAPKWQQLALGRQKVLQRMDEDGIINRKKEHHLLGVALPQDMLFYRAMQSLGKMNWIVSVDTSNPVVHGLKRIWYSFKGLEDKETQKLYTLINAKVDDDQMVYIRHNINEFRRYCNGSLV